MEDHKEENAFIRALLDEPAFRDISIERINGSIRDIEWFGLNEDAPESDADLDIRNSVVEDLVNDPDSDGVEIEGIPDSMRDCDL